MNDQPVITIMFDMEIPCPFCPREFANYEYLNIHIGIMHDITGIARCTQCGWRNGDHTFDCPNNKEAE